MCTSSPSSLRFTLSRLTPQLTTVYALTTPRSNNSDDCRPRHTIRSCVCTHTIGETPLPSLLLQAAIICCEVCPHLASPQFHLLLQLGTGYRLSDISPTSAFLPRQGGWHNSNASWDDESSSSSNNNNNTAGYLQLLRQMKGLFTRRHRNPIPHSRIETPHFHSSQQHSSSKATVSP
ncbi:unnamed protein product [Hydatigera taeniaeformis]|uniref:Secreted protein n=1 Tax=Hydatigena taeniaeformis TaxID=6205 RepID=A0A0R3X661_HYDTA|nr:unnamed protein product [Hydatigera taeniaeformis]